MNCIKSKQVKTRKPHRCWGCEREFPAGTIMQAITCVESGEPGDIHTSYWCPVCIAVVDEDWEEDGYSYGQIRDGDWIQWEEMRKEIEGGENQGDTGRD